MADHTQENAFDPEDFDPNRLARDSRGLRQISFGTGSASTPYYRMRARDDTDSYYVTWTVADEPDPSGTHAPEAIDAGSAVVAATWSV